MFRLYAGAIALALATFAGNSAPADDKKDDKSDPALSGTWLREANGLDVKLEFGEKSTFKLTAIGGENGVTVTCKYTVKDGVLKAEITKVEEKGNFPAKPPVGLEFSFKWKVKGDVATLDDLKGEQLDNAKPVLEGEYDRKKDKAKN
jgi:hypothetical protein